MKTSDFYYDLPEELIAQTPIEPRNASRLMVLNKKTGEVEHKIFKDLTNYLNPGDCLILNDTKGNTCVGMSLQAGQKSKSRNGICFWRGKA